MLKKLLSRPWGRAVFKRYCRMVLLLDYIPAYRRFYRWDPEVNLFDVKPEWRWCWRGYWGLNLLGDLLWVYLEICHLESGDDSDAEEDAIQG